MGGQFARKPSDRARAAKAPCALACGILRLGDVEGAGRVEAASKRAAREKQLWRTSGACVESGPCLASVPGQPARRGRVRNRSCRHEATTDADVQRVVQATSASVRTGSYWVSRCHCRWGPATVVPSTATCRGASNTSRECTAVIY